MTFLDMNDLQSDELLDSDLTTSALWVTNRNEPHLIIPPDGLPKRNQEFHGVFIPYIPYQMIKRFTCAGETVWDCFAGSGTTHQVAELLGRKCISNDVMAVEPYIISADSGDFDPEQMVQLIIMHPPYWKIIQYDGDHYLSGAEDLNEFLRNFRGVVHNVVQFLEPDRMLILVCGNIYASGEEITLGVMCKDIIRDCGFRLRSHIIKTYGETKAGHGKAQRLHRYRMLRGGYNRFYGDNVFILQRRPSKWRKQEIEFWR